MLVFWNQRFNSDSILRNPITVMSAKKQKFNRFQKSQLARVLNSTHESCQKWVSNMLLVNIPMVAKSSANENKVFAMNVNKPSKTD